MPNEGKLSHKILLKLGGKRNILLVRVSALGEVTRPDPAKAFDPAAGGYGLWLVCRPTRPRVRVLRVLPVGLHVLKRQEREDRVGKGTNLSRR